jgi:hypothetical protein
MLVFSVARRTALALQVSASGAFADMMKLCTDNGRDCFDLQKRKDSRVSDFSWQSRWTSQRTALTPELITAWVAIVKSLLSNGSLPNLEIESAIHVKAVCSSTAIELLRTIAVTEPLLNECLDEVVTSTARAIENSLFHTGFALSRRC